MRTLTWALLLGVVLGAVPTTAMADYIVDTGEPPDSNVAYDSIGDVDRAAFFHLDDAATVTTIESFMKVINWGNLTFSIYAGDAVSPPAGSATALYSETAFMNTGQDAWRGISGLSWDLTAGDYWVTFEAVDDNFTFLAWLRAHPPNPLGAYAARHHADPPTDYILQSSSDYIWGDHQFAVRIGADGGEPPVPEPASLTLLTVGLSGLALRRVRKHA